MGDTIVGVQFGIANPADILARSVVEITTDKTSQSGQPIANGVFDPRFGVIENGKVCPSCKQTNQFCPGHFGHIRLARPVYLYQFIDTIEKILNSICLTCSGLLVEDDVLDALNTTGLLRLREINSLRPKPTAKKPLVCRHCASVCTAKFVRSVGKAASFETTKDEQVVPIQIEFVLRAFQRMTDETCRRLGLDPKHARPEWMICTVLAVPPLSVRPSVVMDDNQRMEDDLTHKLVDIIRSNEKLRARIDEGAAVKLIDDFTSKLQYDVATYVDNDIKGMEPSSQRSGRPLRTLKSRFGAKTGRVRGNLMGKRVDFSARSVITPDANIAVDELGVPMEIAMNLTFPETVSTYNRERLLGYVRNGPDVHPGAKSVFLRAENRTASLRYLKPGSIELREGDIVHRHLIPGDIVLFNRQPSLHKASMEAHRIVILPYSTFRLNVSATRPYNADFDGDEMNMHVPQSIASAVELKCIASVLRNIISPRTTSPIIQLFQDTMTGAFRMSQANVTVPEHIAMNILAKIRRPFVRKNKDWTGAELISCAFPLMSHTSSITVKDGQLVKGELRKGAFGKMSQGLVHVVYNDFGPERCGEMINDIQSIVTQFNLYTGFSVGTADLISDKATKDYVATKRKEGRDKVAQILADMHAGRSQNISGLTNGADLENQISSALKSVGSDINGAVIKQLPKSNAIVQMVDSGSKGSEQNITQMVALLGQQQIEGQRVKYTLQDRTLPHFPRYDDGAESRGFIENSFIDGLRPAEFFYHAQAGREGLIDTAVKTSDTGYIQRRLMKSMEDHHVEHDGTVRNVTGTIIQFAYGEDGVDTTCVEAQACELATMTMEAVYSNYALTPALVNPFLTEEVTETPDFVEALLEDREILVKGAYRRRKNDEIIAPVPLSRLVAKYANPFITKTNLTPSYIVNAITRFTNEFPTNRIFHMLLRYYLAPKKSILMYRFSQDLFDELMNDVRFRYLKAMVHAGEMVGALAAQSIGEPTTQLTLNTFHSAGTAKANATSGVPRIDELLQASPNQKRPSNTAYLHPDHAFDQNSAIERMKKIQKTTVRDITRSVRIYYDPYPLQQTVVGEDQDILDAYQLFMLEKPAEASSWILRLELDDVEMDARGITDLPCIQTKINNNAAIRSIQCMHSDASSAKMVLRIAFDKDHVKNASVLRYYEDKVLDTELTGLAGIGGVHLRTIKSELFYDPTVSGWMSKEQYVLDVDGTNLHDLMVFPGVDGTRTFSNDIHEVNAVFGIESARLSILEEFNEVFVQEKINYHHLSVLADSMTFAGRIIAISRFGMSKNETGVLARSSFEETCKNIFNAAMGAEFDTMRGVSANIMFGQKPPCGTGFVDILVDETRLPEMDGQMEETDDPRDAVNAKLGAIEPSECRVEDIRMDW